MLPILLGLTGPAFAQMEALSPQQKERLFRQFEASLSRPSAPALAPAPTPHLAPAPAPRPGGLRIVVHGTSVAQERAALLAASIDRDRDRGEVRAIETRVVDATPSRPTVRFFHAGDEAAARMLSGRLPGSGWHVQDFSGFRPLPSSGTIEVWLP